MFYNPRAGRFRLHKVLHIQHELEHLLGSCRAISDIHELQEVKQAHIVIAGGDGTVHTAINHADLHTNTFSVIAMGSGNDFVCNFPVHSLRDLCRNILAEKTTQVDLLQVNDTRAAVLVGVGFDAFVSDKARKNRIKIPSLKYLIPVARYMFFYKGIQMHISGKDLQYSGRVFMLSCGNGYRAGGGFRLFPKASVSDGKMDVLLIEPPTFWQKLKYAGLVNFGKHLNLNIVKYIQTDSITVRLDNPDFFNTDGDVYTAAEMQITILPGVLKLIQ